MTKVVKKVVELLWTALIAAGWSATAGADDMVARFSGFSAGVYAGAIQGRSNYDTDSNCPPIATNAVFCNAAPDPSAPNGSAVAASGSENLHSYGLTGGVRTGYNWQVDHIVYGIEADFSALDFDRTERASGSFPFPFLGTQYSVMNKTRLDWVSTLRGQLGVSPTPEVLLYVTGGAAFAHIELSSAYSDNAVNITLPGGNGSGGTKDIKIGWVIGGGVQWALDHQWSAKAEYLYTDFDSISVDVPLTNSPAFTQTMSVANDVSLHLMRIGLDYRF